MAGGDVGRCLEVDVVDDHEEPVPGEDHVLLDEVGAEGVRIGGGLEGVLRQVAGGTAVGDDDGAWRGEGGEGKADEREEAEQAVDHVSGKGRGPSTSGARSMGASSPERQSGSTKRTRRRTDRPQLFEPPRVLVRDVVMG